MPKVDTERLRDRRDELDLSNAELARRLEMSEGYLRNILCGTNVPGRRVIYRLSRVLNLPVSEIEAGRRTPHGDPSEPPNQPPNSPKGPPRRQDHDDKKGGTGPRRQNAAVA